MAKKKQAQAEQTAPTTEAKNDGKLNDGYDGSIWTREQHGLDAPASVATNAKTKLESERARPPVHFETSKRKA